MYYLHFCKERDNFKSGNGAKLKSYNTLNSKRGVIAMIIPRFTIHLNNNGYVKLYKGIELSGIFNLYYIVFSIIFISLEVDFR